MYEGRQEKLQEFVTWAAEHITGDEKSQAHIFLDRLFQAFGQRGCLDVGGSPEYRIRKATEDGGGTAFADYVWKPHVLIEMKKRGADLTRHYRQAFDYWTRLVPNRPRYVILSNFDTFHVYDFDKQIDSPVDTVALPEIPDRWGPLAFLFPTNEKPTFDNDRVAATRETADKLALCFRKLITRKVDRALAQHFILQTLVALFAEDIGLLPKYLVTHLLDECREPQDSYDILGGLYEAMNSRTARTGGRYKGVEYFNGGLFAEPARIELYPDEVAQLRGAAEKNWAKVSPEIFGALFQDSMDAEERHAFGAHYTSPVDIMKIVNPTIVKPWQAAIEEAKTPKKLLDLFERLTTLRVLDPACGSGNFLYLAYMEMKELEGRIRQRLKEEFPQTQAPLIHVNARQFYGLDINSFAIELAKVTMMIGRKFAIDKLGFGDEATLPFDNLDQNFRSTDALITRTSSQSGSGVPPLSSSSSEISNLKSELPPAIQTPWPPADVIIGNPPFLGSRYLAKEHGYDYARTIHNLYPDVPKMADFCVYWYRRAHDHLPVCTKADPFAGRAGLVGTQNVRNNHSRIGGLDHIVSTGTILEAVDNQPWSGEANVHVSIANWVKTQEPILLPKKAILWQKVQPTAGVRRLKGARADKDYELMSRECPRISASLSDQTDASGASVLLCNTRAKLVFTGQNPCHDGFKLNPDEAAKLLEMNPKLQEVLFPYMTGQDLVTEGNATRWVIDFGQRDMLEASQYSEAFEIAKTRIMADVLEKARTEKAATGKDSTRWTRMAERWWQFRDWMPGTVAAVEANSRYIVCPRVTKRPTFAFVSRQIRPDMQLIVFGLADDYSFGILQSSTHWHWFVANSSKLTERLRYTSESVFDTFPWPQSPTKKQIDAVAQAGREIRRVRTEALKVLDGGLRALYRTLELPGRHPLKDAHAALDEATLAAYAFSPKQELLAQLLELNHAVAAKERAGEAVTAPGVPATYGNAASLVTDDCIRP